MSERKSVPCTAWITGAHGFIGRYVARALSAVHWQVSGIGHGAWPSADAARDGVSHWLNGDIAASNLNALHRACGAPRVIFHLAGGSSVGFAIEQPREDFSRTVESTAELLEWVRQESPTTSVVAISSAAVYGAGHAGLICESAATNPFSPYGYHKLMMESVCRSYGKSYGVRSIVARLFSVYGCELKKQLLWDLCTKLERNSGRITLGGTGEELRDWVEVGDVPRALMAIMDEASPDVPVYNVGTGIGTPVRDIARIAVSAWQRHRAGAIDVEFSGVSRAGDPVSLVASYAKLEAKGAAPKVPYARGIAEYVDWFVRTVSPQ